MNEASIERITREEIEEAMKKFFQKGGKIKVLPPQVFSQNSIIGGEKLIIYERPEMLFSQN